MPHLDLSDDEAAALIKEHHKTRIRTLKATLAKLSPVPGPRAFVAAVGV